MLSRKIPTEMWMLKASSLKNVRQKKKRLPWFLKERQIEQCQSINWIKHPQGHTVSLRSTWKSGPELSPQRRLLFPNCTSLTWPGLKELKKQDLKEKHSLKHNSSINRFLSWSKLLLRFQKSKETISPTVRVN